jgi:hypothetical protein
MHIGLRVYDVVNLGLHHIFPELWNSTMLMSGWDVRGDTFNGPWKSIQSSEVESSRE